MEAEAYDNLFRIERDLWWYRGRRAVCLALLRRHARPGGRVLDVGCGTGYNLTLLAEFGETHGVEPSPEALAYCRQRAVQRVMEAPAERLPYPDGHFRLVTAFDVIEHLDDDVEALREWARVLEPGGTLLVYTPALPWLYGEHDRLVHHRRRYLKGQLTHRMALAGFQVLQASYVNLLVLPLVLGVRAAVSLLPRRPHVEMGMPPGPVNGLITRLCYAELPLVLGRGLPLGLSLVAVGRRR
ncbi:MAG: class I SAM-dependent methyltransferase [Candidatus Eremiobacterota bacterium]